MNLLPVSLSDDNGITVPDWGPSGVVFGTLSTETISACPSLSVVSCAPTLPFNGLLLRKYGFPPGQN